MTPDDCDIVMKGGITSGIVYQGAVMSLKDEYRLRRVGGASVGAFAAAVTAAAQYGERANPGLGGFGPMANVTETLAAEGAIARLFQPRPRARAALEIIIGFVTGQRPIGSRLLDALSQTVMRSGWGLLVVVVLAAWGAVLTWLGHRAVDLAFWLWLGLGLVVLPAAYAAAVVLALLWLVRAVLSTATRENGFGLCTGLSETGDDALVDWLHARIQECAGTNAVLTCGMLEQEGVTFRTITTDLASGRPVALPLDPQTPRYLFAEDDMRVRFPAPVVQHMVARSELSFFATRDGRPLYVLPVAELPVLVAARLSLSFPLLLSAVRLYTTAPKEAGSDELVPVECWCTDGGAVSNFPVHFFDSWFPAWPTFGLDLQGHRAGEPFVYMPSSVLEQPLPRFRRVGSLATFVTALVDAARNWRDSLQGEVPGFRDRICHIRLDPSEGGLNLNMPPEVVRTLVARGESAAVEIRKFKWPEHRVARFLTLSELLQSNLNYVDTPDRLRGWLPTLAANAFDVYGEGHDPAWCAWASNTIDELLADTRAWRFEEGKLPRPMPALRTVPQV